MKVPFSIFAAAAAGAALTLPGAVLAQEQADAAEGQQSAELNPYACLFDDKPECPTDAVDPNGGLDITDRGGFAKPQTSTPAPAQGPKVKPTVVKAGSDKPKSRKLSGEAGRRKPDAAVTAPEAVAKKANVFVTFRSGSAQFDDGVPNTIGLLADAIKGELSKGGKPVIRIDGHTDSVGDEAYNLTLSEARAQTVRAKLIELGVPAEVVNSVGYGESKPITGYAPTHGINRRVEVVVLK